MHETLTISHLTLKPHIISNARHSVKNVEMKIQRYHII